MNWNDPAARFHLIERVGIDEYNRQQQEEFDRQTVETVNGCPQDRTGRTVMEDIYCTYPSECDDSDCPAKWHKSHYWMYDDGTYSVCDEDGNHEPVDQQDLPSVEELDKAWRDYSEWVVRHGEDPLSEFYVKHSVKRKERWQFRFSNSILGPLLIEAKRAGLHYWWNEVPEHVRQYLNLVPVTFNRGKLADFASWADLIAAQPEIKPGKWWSVEIEHDEPRNPVLVARELRRLARMHLKQNPVKEAA